MAERRSSSIPSKRAKVTQDQVAPDAGVPTAPVFSRKLRKAAVGTGCDIRLRVTVAGFPKPSLTWYHNDEPLPPSEAQDSGGLWIRDCRTNDAGLYTCVAANELGEASCSAVLAVMDLGEGNKANKAVSVQRSIGFFTNVRRKQRSILKAVRERFLEQAARTRSPCQAKQPRLRLSVKVSGGRLKLADGL